MHRAGRKKSNKGEWKKEQKRKKKIKNRKPGETTRACGSMTSAKTKDEGIA